MNERYPGYDVLAKRNSPSWNEQTRAVIDQRLALSGRKPSFFNEQQWETLQALCARIIPQRETSSAPLAAMIDEKLEGNNEDGYRDSRLPPLRQAWTQGLAALDAEAIEGYGCRFHKLDDNVQDGLLKSIQHGKVSSSTWQELPPDIFFAKRILQDIVAAYYSNPVAWNEIGFGGPAAPRGYVRMNFDLRDPWEAAEARPGQEAKARKENSRVG